jgi:Fanconi-associated nuclease 1
MQLCIMVLDSQKDIAHNAMLGRKILHPASTKFYDDGIAPPPPKRLKTFESTDEEDSRDTSDYEDTIPTLKSFRDEIPDFDEDNELEREERLPQRPTELESALAPVKTDKEAIAEYESMRVAEQDTSGDAQKRLDQRSWTKGKSSIYVDAFNLALETVLEDEGHLFDEKEMEVFNQWKRLEYEAQYL